MTRPARITVHLDHIIHNTQLARQLHGQKVLAVIKANAYGHGDQKVAQALSRYVDGFAVACLEEAVTLRQSGISQPIILLEGPFTSQEVKEYDHYQLTPVIHQREQWQWWQENNLSHPVWLKVDTGMHRLGFNHDDLIALINKNTQQPKSHIAVLMTHLANADTLDDEKIKEPLERFKRVVDQFNLKTSIANSAAIMLHPQARGDWARPGLMLYGVDPLARNAKDVGLKPAMTFSSQVIATRWIKAGESVGYGSLFTAQKPTRVATIACGYADGYPRSAPTNTPVWINGKVVPLIGRVSMDMITVDISAHDDIQIGSAVELWGENIAVAEIASRSGTLAYELLCHTQRPGREYSLSRVE
ncbi:MAG: alanine racemase [Betaproteobacteria bacterium]|nr:alanine racemase [Betaproteobacteria bacterium]MDE2423757.1 alanine racemase [Betaproteobacteria bacterium]